MIDSVVLSSGLQLYVSDTPGGSELSADYPGGELDQMVGEAAG